MCSSAQPVTLTPDEIEQIRTQLSGLRHNINNALSLLIAATELIRQKPETAPRFLKSLEDPALKIGEELKLFSDELEKRLKLRPR